MLRPKPTPTPDASTAEITDGDILRINADLVTLNVRVIDRNNRPINGIRQDEFKVFEDGVPQSIFSFTQEEVPVIYGLAVDTSGSLRGAFDRFLVRVIAMKSRRIAAHTAKHGLWVPGDPEAASARAD